jgi:phthiocerol/phenolphthiocerol synthesis type-I polyketide synthase E
VNDLADIASQYAVAIIGMAGRFPRSPDIEQFWHNLRAGKELITFFTPAELAAAGIDHALAEDPDYVPAKGVLDGADLFDSEFFGMTPREAELADPQQRLMLESAWAALEDAGIRPGLERSVGMFIGAVPSGYPGRFPGDPEAAEFADHMQLAIAGDACYLSSRVSYKLGLTGPSMTVQTACSSSLVAVHLACMALLGGECELAIAGGVAIHLPIAGGYRYQSGSIYSPDGHCRAFDADAAGTVGGDGLACVVLRRLEDAIEAADDIYAVVRGTAVNNDGSDKIGFTAPSMSGQAAVIRAAHTAAGVSADTIGYVEAHGTGTALGDPIELAALADVFGSEGRDTPLLIGSVKTNIGHLDAASGVAGLVKAALALRHREVPATLHFRRLNPSVTAPAGLFDFPASPRSWRGNGHALRAGVSSFGIGGTNAHAVLEEYPRRLPRRDDDCHCHLITLSARAPEALNGMASRLSGWFEEHSEARVGDVAYTLQTGRAEFGHRRAMVCAGPADLAALSRPAAQGACWEERAGQPTVSFVFSGQGEQRPGAVGGLCRQEPFFADLVERLGAHARGSGVDLLSLLIPPDGREDDAERELSRPEIAQPALFVQEYALASLWLRWGVEPAAMLGNSLGEYTAACVAGVFTPEDALDLLIIRGRLSAQMCADGVMLAVGGPPERVAPLLADDAWLATRSAPDRCVVSCGTAAMKRLQRALAGEGMAWRQLGVSRAYHSELMRPMCADYARAVAGTGLKEPSRPFISCATGTWITPGQATDPAYWAYEQLLGTVRYSDGISVLCDLPEPVLLGIGPHEGIARAAPQNHRPPPRVMSSLAPQSRPVPVGLSIARALGQLWTAGAAINWAAVHDGHARRRVHLPTYPFERRRHWAGELAGATVAPRASGQGSARPEKNAERRPDAVGGDLIERTVQAIFGEILGIADAGYATSFFDLGGDSLTGTQVVARIREVFSAELSLREFFDDPTVATVAAHIRERMADTGRPAR